MFGIEGEIVIERPVEEVFDFAVDECNEPRYNPHMRRAKQLTDGPIGVGTRFRAEITSMRRTVPMLTELTAYQRPRRYASTTHLSLMDTNGTVTFEPVPQGTLLRWAWQVEPRGALRLTTPIMACIGRRQERAIWAGLKRVLEAHGRDATSRKEGAMASYREDMRRAWDRINSFPTRRLQTRFGTVEYADQGEGLPLLVSHGVLGCHVDSVDGWANLPGSGFRVIAPSRFGYFGSTLPQGATPADQADAYGLLLDHLGVDRAVVIGYSAGSGSVLEFALRHPQRVIGLILASCRLGGGVTLGKAFAPLFRLAYSADLLFWVFKKLMPTAFSQMMGIPKGYRPSPREAEAMAASRELLFPLKPRRDGAVFDGFVSNLVADRFPFEQLTVPTLVISARDDPLAPYRFAVKAASRIPGARLVTIDGGGHFFMGHDAEVRTEIGTFVHEVT